MSSEEIGPRITDQVSTVAWKYDHEGGSLCSGGCCHCAPNKTIEKGKENKKNQLPHFLQCAY